MNNVDDILRIVKTTKEENPDLEEGHTIHLVVSADDLKGMFFNLKKVGYEPGVNFDCRRLSSLYLKFNGLNITIKSQQLVSTILDGDIALEDEAIYNKTHRSDDPLPHSPFQNQFEILLQQRRHWHPWRIQDQSEHRDDQENQQERTDGRNW